MKKAITTLLIFAGILLAQNSSTFPLTVHILRVDMAQGQRGISGSGETDNNGNYSSSVSGGGSYLYHVYTVRIDGDQREFQMTTPRAHFKGGVPLALATMGWSAVATARRNYSLHTGDYQGRWNKKNGSLEIAFTDNRGRTTSQPFYIAAEKRIEQTLR